MSDEAAAGDCVSASGSNAEEEQSGDRFVPHLVSKLYEPRDPATNPPISLGKDKWSKRPHGTRPESPVACCE
jgi:hypothetical protein